MAIQDFEQPPSRDPLIEQPAVTPGGNQQGGGNQTTSKAPIAKKWLSWIFALVIRLNATPEFKALVPLQARAAAIGTTPAHVLEASGLYDVAFFVRVTQVATVNSSVQVTIRWSCGGAFLSWTGTAVIGNTTDSYDTGLKRIRADSATSITYETAYVSVGATPMQYELYVTVQAVSGLAA